MNFVVKVNSLEKYYFSYFSLQFILTGKAGKQMIFIKLRDSSVYLQCILSGELCETYEALTLGTGKLLTLVTIIFFLFLLINEFHLSFRILRPTFRYFAIRTGR